MVAATVVAALAVCVSVVRRRFGPWAWALPAAFAASATEPEVSGPRPGPVWMRGVVRPGVRWEPDRGDCSFRIHSEGGEFLCVVPHAPATMQVLPGDRVEGFGHLADQPERRRAGRTLRVVAPHDGLRISPGGIHPQRLASQCRRAMQNALLECVPGPRGSLLCHLVLGSGPRVEEAIVQAHRETGLSHLLAVSGAHLTMLGWLLAGGYVLCRRRDPRGSRRFRRTCALVLLFYGLLTGMEPPVFRATVAAFLVLGCAGRHRRVPIVAVLTVPAICTAILAPDDLFGVSFNLSYAAVFGLSLAYPGTERSGWWRGPLRCSLWATLCTMPFTLWYFGTLAPWSILLTPILGPLVAAMLGLGLTVGIVHALAPDVAWALALPLRGLASTYLDAIRIAAELPGTPIYAPLRADGWLLLLAGCFGTTGLLALGGRRGVAWLSLCLSAPHFTADTSRHSEPGLELLGVGHGQAALARLEDGQTLLIDCGSLARPYRAAQAVAEALLPRRTLDFLVLTHGDADHVGGVPALLSRVRVARAWMPAEMRGSITATRLMDAGCHVDFVVAGADPTPHCDVALWRPKEAPAREDRNAHSLWTRIRWRTFTALLTGDATPQSTESYLRTAVATAEVLVLPHHGRSQRGIGRLLAKIRPRLALISAAERDGNSDQATVARMTGCMVLITGQVGSITIHASDPPRIHTARPIDLPPRGDRSLAPSAHSKLNATTASPARTR